MKKSLISAIKKLLAKLGAEEVEGNNPVEVIDSGADAIEGGGGSGGIFIVHEEYDKQAQKSFLNKTFSEIDSAMKSGTPCLIVGVEDPIGALHSYIQRTTDFQGTYDVFVVLVTMLGQQVVKKFSCDTVNDYPTISD